MWVLGLVSKVPVPDRLTRRHVTIEFSPYGLLLPAETRRVLLQQIALRPYQARGVVLPHLIFQRAVSRRRQRHAGVDGMQLRGGLEPALLGGNRGTCEANQHGE